MKLVVCDMALTQLTSTHRSSLSLVATSQPNLRLPTLQIWRGLGALGSLLFAWEKHPEASPSQVTSLAGSRNLQPIKRCKLEMCFASERECKRRGVLDGRAETGSLAGLVRELELVQASFLAKDDNWPV